MTMETRNGLTKLAPDADMLAALDRCIRESPGVQQHKISGTIFACQHYRGWTFYTTMFEF